LFLISVHNIIRISGPIEKKAKLHNILQMDAPVVQAPVQRDNDQDTWVDVNWLNIAGLSVGDTTANKTARIFVREEAHEMWRKIESSIDDSMSLSVEGPPGTGKSTEAWAWALWKARTTKKNVVWFHSTSKLITEVIIDGNADTLSYRWVSQPELDEVIRLSACDFMVFDGLTGKNSQSINTALGVWKRSGAARQFITTSSQAIKGTVEHKEEAGIDNFSVPSWTLLQYERACEDDALFDEVKQKLVCGAHDATTSKPELLRAKYYYAGGCARWMFGFNFARFQTDFTTHWSSVGDYSSFFKGQTGEKAVNAVNHLRSIVKLNNGDLKVFFVSKHVIAKYLADVDNQAAFLELAYGKATEAQNPSFRGWVYEFDVDNQLKRACERREEMKVTLRSHGDTKFADESWRFSKYAEFDSTSDLIPLIQEMVIGSVLVAKPKLWCQSAYDFLVFRLRDGNHLHMDALNATRGVTHNVKLHVIHVLGKALLEGNTPVASIRFGFLVPPDQAEFAVGDITGSLHDWWGQQTKEIVLSAGHIAVINFPKSM
jgi:hypothetical protein